MVNYRAAWTAVIAAVLAMAAPAGFGQTNVVGGSAPGTSPAGASAWPVLGGALDKRAEGLADDGGGDERGAVVYDRAVVAAVADDRRAAADICGRSAAGRVQRHWTCDCGYGVDDGRDGATGPSRRLERDRAC